jgi:hypothetical protein
MEEICERKKVSVGISIYSWNLVTCCNQHQWAVEIKHKSNIWSKASKVISLKNLKTTSHDEKTQDMRCVKRQQNSAANSTQLNIRYWIPCALNMNLSCPCQLGHEMFSFASHMHKPNNFLINTVYVYFH